MWCFKHDDEVIWTDKDGNQILIQLLGYTNDNGDTYVVDLKITVLFDEGIHKLEIVRLEKRNEWS